MPNTNHVTHTPNEATYLIINNIFMSDTYWKTLTWLDGIYDSNLGFWYQSQDDLVFHLPSDYGLFCFWIGTLHLTIGLMCLGTRDNVGISMLRNTQKKEKRLCTAT